MSYGCVDRDGTDSKEALMGTREFKAGWSVHAQRAAVSSWLPLLLYHVTGTRIELRLRPGASIRAS